MATIEEVQEILRKNGMAANLQLNNQAAAQGQQPQTITTESVQQAIKSAAEKVNQRKEQARRGEMEAPMISKQTAPDAGRSAGKPAQSDPAGGDQLQQMIREAQAQTDAAAKGFTLLGGDQDLAGASKTLKAARMLLPQDENSAKESWTDNSYTTWAPTTGITRTGKTIAEGAGGILTDSVGQQWMRQQNGGLLDLSGKTQSEINALQKQMQDTSYDVTGRVYQVRPDGKAPQWLSVGDQVVTAGGTYIITGHNFDGGYTTELYDPNQTTGNFRGNYNTGIYGSILGEQNGFADDFKGNRESNDAYTGYGGYSINRQTGETQFDTVAHTFDGSWTRAAVVNGIPYRLSANGALEPLEAGSLIQDASQRYWVIGADGKPIDVTPEDPQNNPLNDPTGAVGKIQMAEAEKAGINLNRGNANAVQSQIDPATQAQIDQWELQLQREQDALEAANRDLYRQYRQGQLQMRDQLAGAGLKTTGAGEKAQANMTAAYLSAMNANQQNARTAEDEVAFQIEQARLQAEQQAKANAQAEAQQKAQTLARYGDFSGYSDLGYTPSQIAGMEAAYTRENATDQAYGGLSSYAQTLLGLYQQNPAYDIRSGLQQALDSGLITMQDYLAALQTAAGMAV